MALTNKKSHVNILLLLRVIGWLLSIEAVFMIIPFIAGLIFGEHSSLQFLICIAITAGCGFGMASLKPRNKDMGRREAIVLTGMTWVILSLFGMLPFLLCGTHLSITDAFFETMSGFTTTGASVLDTLHGVPKSILLWRCVVQWEGGLGIILFTLAVVPMLNYQGGMRLFNAEVTGITHDKLRPRVSFTAQTLWIIYIILTVILICLLVISDMSFFDAICYGLSTISTGGFGNTDVTVSEMEDIYIKIVLMIFMFIGGINFSLIYKAVAVNFKSAVKNDVLKWYVIIIFICYGILALNVWLNGLYSNVADVTIDPLFQAVSILSSTGLTEPDFFDWGPVATVLLIIMMVMGACAGSTSGGAKIDRFMVAIKFLKNEIYKTLRPNAITTVTINEKGIAPPVVMKTLAFLFIYIIVIIIGGVCLVILGLPLKDSFFLSLSSISNTGLGTEISGVAGNFALLPDVAKWILSFIMLIGRLELFTIIVLFIPAFWKK